MKTVVVNPIILYYDVLHVITNKNYDIFHR